VHTLRAVVVFQLHRVTLVMDKQVKSVFEEAPPRPEAQVAPSQLPLVMSAVNKATQVIEAGDLNFALVALMAAATLAALP